MKSIILSKDQNVLFGYVKKFPFGGTCEDNFDCKVTTITGDTTKTNVKDKEFIKSYNKILNKVDNKTELEKGLLENSSI